MTLLASDHGWSYGRWALLLPATSVAAIFPCLVGAFFWPQQFFRAYFFAYCFVVGLAIGGLAIVMIHYLIGGAWGVLVRRFAEAQMRTFPLMAILFVPIGFGLPFIYLWAVPSNLPSESDRSVQAIYLQPDFFCSRAAGYFFVWLTMALVFSRLSRLQDDTDDVRIAYRCNRFSGFGLAALGISLHFAITDWMMSLQPTFTSTIFGPLVFSGDLLSAYSVCVISFCLLSKLPTYRPILSEKVMVDLGSLLFTLLVLWGYMQWFQFMLIWIADLPHGTVWYLARLRGGWGTFTILLVLVHFVVPFVLLLFRELKRDPRTLGGLATWILATHVLVVYEEIVPAFNAPSILEHWMDPLLLVGMCGIWTTCFLWTLGRQPLVPTNDVHYEHAVHLHELDEEEREREKEVAHVRT